MIYFHKWDALKSVKYVSAARINHARALSSRANARPSVSFLIYINSLTLLTSQQGALS